MTQVIQQPSGSKVALKHFEDTISQPVNLEIHGALLGDAL